MFDRCEIEEMILGMAGIVKENRALRKALNEAFYADTEADIASYVGKHGYADVEEVRHGKWVKHPLATGVVQCSECAYPRDCRAGNYCPECSAKMDGKGEDDSDVKDLLYNAYIKIQKDLVDSEVENLKLKLIPNWQNENIRCHFCGSTQSVKYQAEVFDPVVDDTAPTKVCICNKCALFYFINKGKEHKA